MVQNFFILTSFLLAITGCSNRAPTPYANVGINIPIGSIGNSNVNIGIGQNGKIHLDLGGGIRIGN